MEIKIIIECVRAFPRDLLNTSFNRKQKDRNIINAGKNKEKIRAFLCNDNFSILSANKCGIVMRKNIAVMQFAAAFSSSGALSNAPNLSSIYIENAKDAEEISK